MIILKGVRDATTPTENLAVFIISDKIAIFAKYFSRLMFPLLQYDNLPKAVWSSLRVTNS